MLSIRNSMEMYDSLKEIFSHEGICVTEKSNIYLGHVTLNINPNLSQELKEDFPCYAKEKFNCRSILFRKEKEFAKDLWNDGIYYRILPENTRNIKESFYVEDYVSLERMLLLDIEMFVTVCNYIMQSGYVSQEDKEMLADILNKSRKILERLKFNERLTPQDIVRIRKFILDNSNLYKLAGLFGLKKSSDAWFSRKDYQKNNIGDLFPIGYFEDLTADEYFTKLAKYSYLSPNKTKYETPKGREKYFKGVVA